MTDLPGADAARSIATMFALTLARPDASKRVHARVCGSPTDPPRDQERDGVIGALSEQGHTRAVALVLSFAHLSAWSGQKREALTCC